MLEIAGGLARSRSAERTASSSMRSVRVYALSLRARIPVRAFAPSSCYLRWRWDPN